MCVLLRVSSSPCARAEVTPTIIFNRHEPHGRTAIIYINLIRVHMFYDVCVYMCITSCALYIYVLSSWCIKASSSCDTTYVLSS